MSFILFPSFLAEGVLQQPEYKQGSVLTPLYGLGQGNRNFEASALGGRTRIGSLRRVFQSKSSDERADYLLQLSGVNITYTISHVKDMFQLIAYVVEFPLPSNIDITQPNNFSVFFKQVYSFYNSNFSDKQKALFDSFYVYTSTDNSFSGVFHATNGVVMDKPIDVSRVIRGSDLGCWVISGPNAGPFQLINTVNFTIQPLSQFLSQFSQI